MKDKENLLEKDSLKKAISTIGDATFTLIYDGNETAQQIKAGKELLQAKWILVAICDHVFDYYPASYFMNEDDKNVYPEYLSRFLENPEKLLSDAIFFVKNNFVQLETVTRDEYNQHRVPRRNAQAEEHVLNVLEVVSDNLLELVDLLKKPKKINDPDKPKETEIKSLIEAINRIQKMNEDFADKSDDSELSLRVFQFNQALEMYKDPLLMAWQLYHYGWHTDFWEEGHSMFEYMMFEAQAKNIIGDLIKSLQENSPFAQFEKCSLITNGLLHVYRHMLTQDLRNA